MARRNLSAFPTEFYDAWKLAVAGKLRIVFETHGKAIRHRQEMNTYRRRLAEESPVVARDFFEADLLVTEEEGKGILTSHKPSWKQQVQDALIANGFDTPKPVEAMEAVEEVMKEKARDGMADVLKKYGYTSE